jgi:2-polyprenyl-6-methoxyphenol hydroxylase-like FAD-dependent oxidoreductase
MTHDVVIVGASVAGCTAATLFARAGLRVALLEKHRSPDTYKVLCGHFVLGGTQEMLRRTGLWEPMVEAGAVAGGVRVWRGGGWTPPPHPSLPATISLRRERLDPLLRRIAAETPGVDLVLGCAVDSLIDSAGEVVGVRANGVEYRARLVVGADGHRSTVARLAGVPEDQAPNERFARWAYYRGIPAAQPCANRIWQLEPDVAIVVRTDDDLTMLVAFPGKGRLAEFTGGGADALERFCAALPDGPDLSDAERMSKVVGTNDYPCLRRDPAPRPGLALVGDAAIAGDPQPAVGCGWAFRAAEWLVESLGPALRDETPVDAAVAAYRQRMAFIVAHDDVARQAALALPPDPVEAAVLRAAAVDPEIGRLAYLFGMRAIPVAEFLNPTTISRAMALTG